MADSNSSPNAAKKHGLVKKDTKVLIEDLRQQCMEKGVGGLKGLSVVFRTMDSDYSQCLTLGEFKIGAKKFGLKLTDADADKIFSNFDMDGNGTIDFRELMISLRPPLAKCRLDVINEAFDKLDVKHKDILTLDDLKESLSQHAATHPKVVSGEWTVEKVLQSFIDTYDDQDDPDGQVSRSEFVSYYAALSTTIDDDCYFDLMMRSCWGLPPRGSNKRH